MFDICRKSAYYSKIRFTFGNSGSNTKNLSRTFSEKPDKRAVDGRHDYRSDAYAAESAEKASVSTHAAARQQNQYMF